MKILRFYFIQLAQGSSVVADAAAPSSLPASPLNKKQCFYRFNLFNLKAKIIYNQLDQLQVMKTQYSGGNKVKFAGKEIVPVQKHLTCKCQCKVKESV